ncbi:acid-sensing ion channel 4-A-like [Dermacentor andersoni]|uniref:acid-sensing ion channel 4-A-like n=1 Tax=Dermacentor andersoni TaxID=34620 RepID=UPI002155D302|nr:amiloride-sensitive sodium channel subunit gamma-like [Dermacentor andersoni]
MSTVRRLRDKLAKAHLTTTADRTETDDEGDDEQERSFGALNRQFAERCTAHGFNRIASTRNLRRFLWIAVVVVAVGGFLYHISFLTANYFSYPIMTATEEVHAEELHFPSITVCNLNLLRKSSFDDYLKDIAARAGNPSNAATTTAGPDGGGGGGGGAVRTAHGKTRDMFSPASKGYSGSGSGGNGVDDDEEEVCYKSVDEFLKSSRTMDLSDMWMNFIATKDQLQKFGHQANDLVVQCTYNARNCFDESHSILRVEAYPSPRYGLCQTIRLANDSMRKVRKTGPTLGMRLTLNIERSEYLDIISPEFGARILIHPLGTLPSLERGGITLTPGSKSYISIRMRKIERLPEPYRGCSMSFNDSRITPYLREVGLDDLIQRSIYTFDFCQTLCREAALLRTCGCLDELSTSGRAPCDLCNVTQARCRTRYLRSYTSSSGGQQCKALCLPECVEVRYDLTTSQSEWPNFRQQAWAIKRWPLLNKRMQDAGIRWQEVLNTTNDRSFLDELLAFRGNFMRVHIYIQEMNYLSVRDLPAYPLPQLFADLGGCLGLYIGVSAITIFEFLEHVFLLVNHLCERHCGCCKRQRASQRPKAEWRHPPPARDEKADEYRTGGEQQQRRKPWSFLIRDREYPVLGRPPSRSPLFRTVYSSSRDYAAPPAGAPTRRPLYLGYTVPQHVDDDGGFFGRRFQTNKDSLVARVRSHRSDESREHIRPRIL